MPECLKKMDLKEALDLGSREHVAIVGGGGKTTLMFSLAKEFQREGRRVVTSTTTKVWEEEVRKACASISFVSEGGGDEAFGKGLDEQGSVFIARSLLESGKLEGIDPEQADRLWQEPGVDCVILEADGAAGRPVKVPGENEPVIPLTASTVVAVMGLDAVGQVLGPDVVFRQEPFQRLTGMRNDDRLTPKKLALIFLSEKGLFKNTPPLSKRIAFLNKMDLLPDSQTPLELATLLIEDPRSSVNRVVIASLKKGRFLVVRKENAGNLS